MDRTISLSPAEKIGEAIRRSLPYLPGEARQMVESMLEPRSLVIIAASVVAWAGSHLIGVGEFVDVILLVVGTVTVGFSVFEAAHEMLAFASGALRAHSNADLDWAGRHFAKAVTILGIAILQAVLLRGGARAVRARGLPRYQEMLPVDDPPPAGNQLRISRPATLDSLGGTDAYGAIEISRDQSLSEQRITLLHELVHRYFSPRVGPFRRFRASLRMTGYVRSALLRYIEEALAEGYAQLRAHGLAEAVEQLRFPIDRGYVTVSEVAKEGQSIGVIVVGGMLLHVSVSLGPTPRRR